MNEPKFLVKLGEEGKRQALVRADMIAGIKEDRGSSGNPCVSILLCVPTGINSVCVDYFIDGTLKSVENQLQAAFDEVKAKLDS